MRKFNSAVLSFTTLAVLGVVSQPVLAGESYVINKDTVTHSTTTTDLHLDSKDWSEGYREWENFAFKKYYDGSVTTTEYEDSYGESVAYGKFYGDIDAEYSGTEKGTVYDKHYYNDPYYGYESGDIDGSVSGKIYLEGTEFTTSTKTTSTDYADFTYHVAGASESGYEHFGNDTHLYGTIFTETTEKSNAHETVGGNR